MKSQNIEQRQTNYVEECTLYAPVVPLRADIRSDPEMNIEAGGRHRLNELDQVLPPSKIVLLPNRCLR